jgi:signal peptidase I
MKEYFKIALFVSTSLVFVLLLRATIVEGFRIPSESMFPTLKVNDHILVWKLSYGLHVPLVKDVLVTWGSPARHSPIVFFRDDDPKTEAQESQQHLIKRVVALPGETVEIKGRQVLINSVEIQEPYAIWRYGGSPGGNYGPVTVPPNHFFVLGDNRDQSQDSRFWGEYPFVSIDKIVGRSFLIYSAKEFSRIGTFIR